MIVAGATGGDPDLDAAGRLSAHMVAAARKSRAGPQFDVPEGWDGKAGLLLVALLWVSAKRGSV